MKLFLFTISVVSVSASSVSSDHLLKGVDPSLLSHYNTSRFTCLDGSATLPSSSVNDDYCDCLDGSDEPGTSACALLPTTGTTFYCRNQGYIPYKLKSSRVHDGICDEDCCDGSDEESGKCPNTCAEKGAILREKEQARKRAAFAKLQMLHEIPALREERSIELSEVRSDFLELTLRHTKAKEKLDPLQDQFDNREKLEKNKELYDSCSSFVTPLTKMVNSLVEGILDAGRDSKLKVLVEKATAISKELAALEATANPPTYGAEFESDYNDAKNSFDDIDKEYNQTNSFVEHLTRRATQVYNISDGAMEVLDGDCWPFNSSYGYSVCPFYKVTQTIGSREVLLGKFSSFVPETTETSNPVMLFKNGEECWSGLSRSLKLTFECAEKNEVTEIKEPSTCEYTATFKTPALCGITEEDKKAFVPSKTRVYPEGGDQSDTGAEASKHEAADLDDIPVHDDL